MKVNFVISKDLGSRIFCDIFKRYVNCDQIEVFISEKPIDSMDIYHYHRVHLEDSVVGPWVATVHHDPLDIDPWLSNDKFYKHYKHADCIICLNSLQVEELARHKITRTQVIPHGYDAQIFSKKQLKLYNKNRKINIGVISKRYKRRFKGEVLLYEILHQLSPLSFSFTFVGEGRLQDAEYASKLGFEVRCFEFMPYRLFSRLYNSIDFLLMVSNFEGGPANMPEAIASGTPVLATNVGMSPELVINGVNGMLLTGDASVDCKIIADISKNKDNIYNKLMMGAIESETAISWDAVINKHLELYGKITGQEIKMIMREDDKNIELNQVELEK